MIHVFNASDVAAVLKEKEREGNRHHAGTCSDHRMGSAGRPQ